MMALSITHNEGATRINLINQSIGIIVLTFCSSQRTLTLYSVNRTKDVELSP